MGSVSTLLSRAELCFALLVESHLEACQCLFDFVAHAVKARYPDKWKSVLLASLGNALGDYVMFRMENNLAQTDIYSVCKLLRSQIHCIVSYCGGVLLDVRQKERLCLQVQALETARHWVFHGDQNVSPNEVRTSVSILEKILITLSCKWQSMACVAEKLSRLVVNAERLAGENPDGEYLLHCDTIVSALVYNSLAEMKENFEEMFYLQNKAQEKQTMGKKESKRDNTLSKDFSVLFKNIRKAITEHPKDKDFPKGACIAMCKSIQNARNKLAHSPPFTLSEGKQVLSDIHCLLEHFCLSKQRASFALERIGQLGTRKENSRTCILSKESSECHQPGDRERILRPAGKLFIGRQEELCSIQRALSSEEQSNRQSVLIFGPAGIGKSYLAMQAATSLLDVFNKQTWLSCSSCEDLRQDSSFLPLKSKDPCRLQAVSRPCSACLKCESETPSSRLVVFDDVSPSTMTLIPKLITRNICAIITTRNTTVKLFLRQELDLSHVVELKTFSLSESWSVVRETVKLARMDTQTLSSIDKVLNEVLEHLPLCVGIYSSWLASAVKKKPRKAPGDCDSKDSDTIAESSIFNWREVEESFGDRLHVRGLTGVVQASVSYLEDHPLVVILVAKICVTRSNRIPWEVIRKSYRWTAYDIEPRLKNLVYGFLGLTDWLFSDRGQHTLVACRDALEELGLIDWETSTATIHVHGLTLQCLQQMLAGKGLCLGKLCGARPEQIPASNIMCGAGIDTVFQCISEELLLQVFSRGTVILRQAASQELTEGQMGDVRFAILPFLLTLVRNTSSDCSSKTMLSPALLRKAQVLLIESLISSNELLGVPLDCNEWTSLRDIYKQNRGGESLLAFLTFSQTCGEGDRLFAEGALERALQNYEEGLACIERAHDRNSYMAIYAHSKIAKCIQRGKGLVARREYLEKASKKCPRLVSEPTPLLVQQEVKLLQKTGFEHIQHVALADTAIGVGVEAWQQLTELQVEDSFQNGHCSDNIVVETVLALITLRQTRQHFLMEELMREKQQDGDYFEAKMINISLALLSEAHNEGSLWFSLRKYGRSLRSLVRAIRIVTSNVGLFDQSRKNASQLIAALKENLQECFDICFLFVGHFSLATKILDEFSTNLRPMNLSKQYPPSTTTATKGYHSESSKDGSLPISSVFHGQNGIAKWIERAFRVYNQLRVLYEEKQFHTALTGLVTCLADISQRSAPFLASSPLCYVYQQNIMFACLIVAESARDEAASNLRTLSRKETVSPTWRNQLAKCCQEIGKRSKLRHKSWISKVYREWYGASAAGDLSGVWKASLTHWRKISESGVVVEMKAELRLPQSTGFLIYILPIIVLEQAKNLQRLYTNEERYSAADWFANFCFQFAKEMRWSFLAAKYGMEYADFLRDRGRHSEAVEQCCLVHLGLKEDFGHDYLEWLPDIPRSCADSGKLDEGQQE